jgi:hypothetical protein
LKAIGMKIEGEEIRAITEGNNIIKMHVKKIGCGLYSPGS